MMIRIITPLITATDRRPAKHRQDGYLVRELVSLPFRLRDFKGESATVGVVDASKLNHGFPGSRTPFGAARLLNISFVSERALSSNIPASKFKGLCEKCERNNNSRST